MPALLLLFSLALSMAYLILILWLYQGWRQLPEWKLPPGFIPSTFISVVVPARNEAENIAALLKSLQQQSYPDSLYEVLVVDDFSEDRTSEIVEGLSGDKLRLIRMADVLSATDEGSKKKALEAGIRQARGSLIVTTDADCIVPQNWLIFLASFYEKHHFRIFGAPVNFFRERSSLERFQSLDYLGMMGLTGAGIQLKWFRMANGANLAYEKKAFEAVNGFQHIDQVASGDDVLLIQKMNRQFPQGTGFLKAREATVLSYPQTTWTKLRQQRRRWASKSLLYKDQALLWIQALVFLLCFSILFTLFLLPWIGSAPFLILFVSKTAIDYFFLSRMAAFFNRKELLKHFFFAQFMHIWYIFELGISNIFFKQFEWKGRKRC